MASFYSIYSLFNNLYNDTTVKCMGWPDYNLDWPWPRDNRKKKS